MSDLVRHRASAASSTQPSDARAMATRAHRDATRAIARDIPDPEQYARYIPLEFAQILLSAQREGTICHVTENQARVLRPFGLVEYGGRFLTAFGLHVRRALKAEDA